jgi:hypothetical protein
MSKVTAVVIILCLTTITIAHEGPPYPLFVDKKVDPYIISVWTDPDVGTGLFFVILTVPEPVNLPSDLRIQIGVKPASGRRPEAFYNAKREQVQGQVQYRAEVQFDTEELWQVRVRLESARGNAETIATVEVTPPGYGRWDLLVYLMPFLAIGLLWAIAMIRKTRRRTVAH